MFADYPTLGTLSAYSAPLNVYKPLHGVGVTRPGDTVCIGKEWYRFPSSFNLPHEVRPKFIKSEFSGLLPGEFSEANIGFGVFPGTWLVPLGMNDENLEDPGKYVCLQLYLARALLTTQDRDRTLRLPCRLKSSRCTTNRT